MEVRVAETFKKGRNWHLVLVFLLLANHCFIASSGFSFNRYNTNMNIISGNAFGKIAFSGRLATSTSSRRLRQSILWSTKGGVDNDDVVVKSTSTVDPNSNEYLVQTRLAIQAAKRQSRKAAQEEDRQRNLRLKRLLHTRANENGASDDGSNAADGSSSYPVPQMYAIRVSVDKELREELKMNGREKRGRVFIECGTDGCQTLKGIKYELHAFFRALKKSTYLLSAGLPEVNPDGSILSPGDEALMVEANGNNENHHHHDPYEKFWQLESDEDVVQTFDRAQTFFEEHNRPLAHDAINRLKRPSILIHVRKDPNAPPPPPPPAYLTNMANPKETTSMTMLSFYSFPPSGVEDPEEFALILRKVWKPFGALGRVYVANEGINAQMSIPTNVLKNFRECCLNIPELGSYMENGINIDPIPLSMDEFAVAGDKDGEPCPPFRNLHVRVRQQIVADGLDKSLDWESAGYDMPPMEWHQKLKEARDKRENNSKDGVDSSDVPLIFDCRNDYETSVGIFEGAEPLDTENFRDSWDVFKDKLKDTPKDTPIMTYCTGGIRCVKVGAYLTQEMGFTNVSRLAGGIIAYDRTLNNEAPEEEPMFKGTNYVFDGRVGRQITDDALGDCITCGAKTNLVTNCKNTNCHKRMVQCEKCQESFLGTCSDACKNRVINKEMAGERQAPPKNDVKYDSIDDYSLGHSTPPVDFYEEIKSNTAEFMGSGLHMISDTMQGRMLYNLASMAREGRVLEIGGFTGYATCCFLEGSAAAADVMGRTDSIGNREAGPFVMSLERDNRAIDISASHVGIMAKHGLSHEAAKEAAALREEGLIPEVKDDSIHFIYKNAGCEIVRVTDALAYVEAIAGGISNETTNAFDIVFIDADKTRFLQYVEACLINDKVLRRGGIMIVDNVLWKGLVLGANNGSFDTSTEGLNAQEVKKSRRARKLANAVHDFNSAIVQDDRVEVIMIPMRDGLSVIRKK